MPWLRHLAVLFLTAFVRPTPASAFTPASPETRVGGFGVVAHLLVGELGAASLEQHQEISVAYDENASGYRFAARGAAGAVEVGEHTLTRTVAGKLAERTYLNSPLTFREIMAAGKPIPDPGSVAGALRWDVPGAFRGSAGTWELVVDPQSKTVLHWLFKSAPKPAP